ncbi:hypothetical protein D9613_011807 [Agrocybe pediades]|uniref:Uncharacterized protein n=1 Tax=Agrocybe pediades TaxID=84607 RepID=A0A8H4QKR4_9AGAR|nr:hypothetical protein D9613_011807 [Agrocybe pediades]
MEGGCGLQDWQRIIGTISDSTRPFIFSILRQKWQNVQYLVVKDEDMHGREILPTWSFLGREAPKLEVFKLLVNKYDEGRDTRYILPFSPLFNNSAPRLKEFMTLQPFRLIVPSPWMFNLHTVTLRRQENTSLILSALKSMPLLRTLIISGNPWRRAVHAEDSDLDKPLLPMLETLWIRDCDPIQLMLLLESITLPPGQRILRTLQIPAAIPPPRPRFQERTSRAVVKWVHDYIAAFPPHYFALGDFGLVLFLTDSQSSEKGFRLDLLVDGESHHTIKNIADSSRFSNVERLRIFLDASPRWPLLPLHKALRSITYLISCGPGLGTLFQDMLQFSLFLDLHTIDLSGPDQDITIDDRRGNESVIPRIIDFLEHRESIESPISVLDLSSLRADGVSDINKERLGKISGLSVKFPQGV